MSEVTKRPYIAAKRALDTESPNNGALQRARRKACWRLLPLLFLCCVVAYVERSNTAGNSGNRDGKAATALSCLRNRVINRRPLAEARIQPCKVHFSVTFVSVCSSLSGSFAF